MKRVLAWIGMTPAIVWVVLMVRLFHLGFSVPDGFITDQFFHDEGVSLIWCAAMLVTAPIAGTWLSENGFFSGEAGKESSHE